MTEQLPHWDLSTIYPGVDSPEFAAGQIEFQAGLDDLDAYLDAQHIRRGGPVPADPAVLAQTLGGYLDRMNAVLRLGHTLRYYAYGLVNTDSYDHAARRAMSATDALLVRAQQQAVRFRGWMGTVAGQPALLAQALDRPGPAAEHRFFLAETVEQSRYLMSEAEEDLAAELSLSGGLAWQNLHRVVTSQVTARLEHEGRSQELPITVVQNLRTHPDELVRRRAYEAELAAWEQVLEPLAACLNGVKGAVNTLNTRRGRPNALHEALDQARIDRQTLDAMLGAMKDSFPAFRRYFRHKARLLGKEALPWWDLFAPVTASEPSYSFAEAQEVFLAQFASFAPDLAAFARRALDRRWIDAEPRAGKSGGAFCMAVPALEESRVLCNFDGTLDGVSTIAHELGHAYHNECQVGKTMLQRHKPMTLAETASITCETIVTDALLAQAGGVEEKRSILELFLGGAAQVIVDIYSRFLFEQEVFQRRATAELSAGEMNDIMLSAQKAAYGDGLDHRYLNPTMWAWKPHYYRPSLSFYNFPYAFGLLFGLGLYAVYQERGEAFLPDYRRLLRDSGEGTPAELAARFGLDLRQRAFWEGSLRIVAARIDEFCSL